MNPRFVAACLAAFLATSARAAEFVAVLAVGDPPSGPDADLAELAHQLRGACRDRVGGVLDVPTMRSRFLGLSSNATLAELDRAYGGALAVYQNGEFESAVRTLRAIIEDLESLPESEEAFTQWRRALLRLAHATLTLGREPEAEAAMVKLLRVDPGYRPDEDQFSPAYRKRFDALRARVKAMPARKLVVTAEGRAGTVFVDGRPMGTTPLTLQLPAGAYRVGGSAGALHVPSFAVDLEGEDRAVVLDFALAGSLRVNAGPGLALGPSQRAYGLIRAGAWLGADKLVVASRATEGDAQFLLGALYDVRRGALLREGSVRMVAGSVPSVNLGALAAFLLTGQSSREVKDRTPEVPRGIPLASPVRPLEREAPAVATPAVPAPPPVAALKAAEPASKAAPPAPAVAAPAPVAADAGTKPAPVPARAAAHGPAPALAVLPPVPATEDVEALPRPLAPARAPDAATGKWMRRSMWISGGLALGLGALAVQQGLSASSARADADAMVRAGAVHGDESRWRDLDARADAASRNMYLSAGVAVALAATAGALGWMTWDREPGPPAIRF